VTESRSSALASSATGIPGTAIGGTIRASAASAVGVSNDSSGDPATNPLPVGLSVQLNGGYVAAGVAMRNLGYGTIDLTGIPSGSTVYGAYLLWDVLNDSDTAALAEGSFDGASITGSPIGTGSSPCWPNFGETGYFNYAFQANVTSLVTGNGSYDLSGFASGATNGEDPFQVGSPFPELEGASLVVIYKNLSIPLTTVQLYARATETDSGNLLQQAMSGFSVSASPNASTTFIVADGQGTGSNGTFNGTTLVSDFLGSAPQAVPSYSSGNLWDTLTFSVSSLVNPGDTTETATVEGTTDCVVWVGQVFSVTTATPTGGAVGDQMAGNPSMNAVQCESGPYPINCASGDFWHTFNDLSVPGRGVPLDLTQTYNSALTATAETFGYGWSSSYGMSASVNGNAGDVTITQENGSTDVFTPNDSGGYTTLPSVFATLVQNADGSYTFTRRATEIFTFSPTGKLVSESDRNGYVTSLAYKASGQLQTVTDPEGRTIQFTYGTNGFISSATDSSGRTVTFSYDANGDLTDLVDAADRHWQFTYNSSHQMLTMREPNEFGNIESPAPVVTNTYDSDGRVISQSDPLGLVTAYDYTSIPGSTMITDPNGNVTVETYVNGELASVTKGYGTPGAATWYYAYDPATLGVTWVADADGNVTTNTYDADGNLLTTTDAVGNTTTYTYNSFDEVLTKTTPLGETTTNTYDADGNLLTTTDAVGNTTTYTYDDGSPGDVTSVTDPDGRVTTYTYDADGDLSSTSVSPSSGTTDTTTYVYNADGELTCSVLPDEVADGVSCPTSGDPRVSGTTTYTYQPDGDLTSVTDPNGHETTYDYDANGNATQVTNPNGDVTTTTYDADNRVVATTTGANGPAPSTTSYGYDLALGSGLCSSSVVGATYCSTTIDPNGNPTVDYYNALDELVEMARPGGILTTYSYDPAGNMLTSIDAEGRTTSYTYDADNRRISVGYSDGTTPDVTYTYNADGERTQMTDGTGTTTYTYDADGRTTSETDGAGATVSYGYDGAGDVTSITYPNGESVTRTYDGARRLGSVTDWNGNTTTFSYDADGNLVQTSYPNGDEISSIYDPADELLSSDVAPSGSPGSPLASISYERDAAGLVTQESDSGALSGTTTYTYDASERLTSSNGSAYGYDAAGNQTGLPGGTTQEFNSADELTQASSGDSSTVYTDDAIGDRTSATYSSGAETLYGYDQAGRLTSVESVAPPLPTTTTTTSTTTVPTTTTSSTTTTVPTTTTTSTTTTVPTTTTSSTTTTVPTTTTTSTTTTVPTTTTTSTTTTTRPPTTTTITALPPTSFVTGVVPSKGPKSGGTLVQIIGLNFRHVLRVKFGPRSAVFFVLSKHAISAVSPPGSGIVNVVVTTLEGSSPESKADEFTYVSHREKNTFDLAARHPGTNTAATFSSKLTAVASPSFVLADDVTSPQMVATYSYNGDSLRMSETTVGGTEQFTWDTEAVTPELLVDGAASYIYGPNGLQIEQIASGGTVDYYFHDALGSTRLLLGSTATVDETLSYGAYGATISENGTATTPFQYTGGYEDSESGLYYFINRYYDPSSAQFLTVDPADALTLEPYSYVGNNPTNVSDPLGLFSIGGVLSDVSHDVSSAASGAWDYVSGAVSDCISSGWGCAQTVASTVSSVAGYVAVGCGLGAVALSFTVVGGAAAGICAVTAGIVSGGAGLVANLAEHEQGEPVSTASVIENIAAIALSAIGGAGLSNVLSDDIAVLAEDELPELSVLTAEGIGALGDFLIESGIGLGLTGLISYLSSLGSAC
jgi:RHS repeat-associated protein